MNISSCPTDNMHLRKKYSCETQLTTVINDWVKILDKGGQIDTFLLDLEKTFDTLPHELLKSKLFGYGIGEKTLRWIYSFLCYRTQLAVVNGETGVGSSFVRCPTRGHSWSIIVLSVHKWYFHRHRLRNKTFGTWLCLLSWNQSHRRHIETSEGYR